MAEEAVKVAVRVRPFNQREKTRNAKLIIDMNGQSTKIEDPDNVEPPKTFTFDFSYWSHDGYKEMPNGYLEPESSSNKYASQKKVFDDLGRGVLENAFLGFNCSLFAYGQTGSGKSYSMVGYGSNKGIVPVTCESLFQRIEGSNNKAEVTFSMLEIYNEQVNDLLSRDVHKGGLQVRQHPSQGYFYAQDLKRVPVGSYVEIERRIEEGTANRTIASTNMNATSSRAHTVVTITFDQIFNTPAGETKKSSVINLVDLAGSERADSTGATGDRLKEGANINKSLSVLGNVISALADLSSGKKKVLVPYRDSVLTKLLQNALGGNSKTIMIAALSPADINYSETLSTLRYADRAKRIKTKAIVNENPVDKLIRELKEENDRLKSIIEGGKLNLNLDKTALAALSEEEIEALKKQMYDELRAQMQMNQRLLQETNTSFKERLQMAQKETDFDAQQTAKKEERKNKLPYLTNLNEDSLLSYVICHFIDQEQILVGRTNECQIQLSGLGILSNHAYLSNQKGRITIAPCQKGAKIKLNGQNIDDVQVLKHNDRILFGSSNMFVFINPVKQDAKEKRITWELAQNEIAEAKGFSLKNTSLTKEQQMIQEEIIELLPPVTEVNAISEELNKHRLFEVVLVPSIAFEETGLKTNLSQKVMVRMTNLKNMNEWLWDKGKFMNRKFMMVDLYQKFLDGEEFILRLKKEEDPFWEPAEDLFIGLSNFFLQSLAYCMDFEDKAYISDYKGQEIGTMRVHIAPCSQNGKPLGEKAYMDDPNKLIGKPFHYSVSISSCEIANRDNALGFKMKFKVFGMQKYVETPLVSNSHEMKFNFNQIISYPSITKEHLGFFEHGSITFLVYAVQKEVNSVKNVTGLSTRELKILRGNERNETFIKSEIIMNGTDIDPTQIKLELSLLQRKHEILEERELQIVRLINGYSKNTKNSKDLQQFIAELNKILSTKASKK